MTDDWFDQPDMQAAALAGINDRITTMPIAADLTADPIAAAIANRLDIAVANHTGTPVSDRQWLIGTALQLAGAVRNSLGERDLKIIAGKQLFALEHRAGRDPVDATLREFGQLAFIVRDLMDAAGYQYDPGRPLAEQTQECGQRIRDFRECLAALQVEFAAANQRYDTERQRLGDLADELRKQLAGADRHTEQLQQQLLETRAELHAMRKIVMDKDEALEAAEDRVANLGGISVDDVRTPTAAELGGITLGDQP